MSHFVFHGITAAFFNCLNAGVKRLVLALLASQINISHAGAIFHGTPDNYLDLLKQLSPGDTLLLQPGIYRNGMPLVHIEGKPGQPIVIIGPTSSPGAKFLARPNANTISIVNSSYIEIRHLELDGQGLHSDAVKAEGHARWAHHITLDDLYIHGHAASQQTVGISSKCPAWGWTIRNNRIVGAGTGIYLGNSDGSAPFVDGLIERNLIVNTLGYNLQIKHQHARPDLPGMPTARKSTIIRHNVFSKEHGASSGPMGRPNVLLGHFPLKGSGIDDIYLVYGNLFYQNPTEALFQGEGNVALYNNLFVNHSGNAINIQPHNDIPRHVEVLFNTVVASGNGIRILSPVTEPAYPRYVTGNLVFADISLTSAGSEGDFTQAYTHAVRWLVNPQGNLKTLDLRIKPGASIPPAKLPQNTFLTDIELDFSGQRRAGWVPGAFDLNAQPLSLPDLRAFPQRP